MSTQTYKLSLHSSRSVSIATCNTWLFGLIVEDQEDRLATKLIQAINNYSKIASKAPSFCTTIWKLTTNDKFNLVEVVIIVPCSTLSLSHRIANIGTYFANLNNWFTIYMRVSIYPVCCVCHTKPTWNSQLSYIYICKIPPNTEVIFINGNMKREPARVTHIPIQILSNCFSNSFCLSIWSNLIYARINNKFFSLFIPNNNNEQKKNFVIYFPCVN